MIPSNLIWIIPAKGKVIHTARASIPEVQLIFKGMEIQLNNQSKEIAPGFSVQQLVDDTIGQKQKGIAVAINNNVIPKTSWAQYIIESNDNILIIKATQGG